MSERLLGGGLAEYFWRGHRLVYPVVEGLAAREVFSDDPNVVEYPPEGELWERCRGGYYLDIGGHVGCAAVYFMEQLQCRMGEVFEPDPRNFGWLQRNVRGLNVVTHQVAVVGSCCRELHDVMFCCRTPGYLSGVHDTGVEGNRIVVDSVPILDVLEVLDGSHPLLMKLDCEGMESSILSNVQSDNLRPEGIVVEIHGGAEQRVESLLYGLGYHKTYGYGKCIGQCVEYWVL